MSLSSSSSPQYRHRWCCWLVFSRLNLPSSDLTPCIAIKLATCKEIGMGLTICMPFGFCHGWEVKRFKPQKVQPSQSTYKNELRNLILDSTLHLSLKQHSNVNSKNSRLTHLMRSTNFPRFISTFSVRFAGRKSLKTNEWVVIMTVTIRHQPKIDENNAKTLWSIKHLTLTISIKMRTKKKNKNHSAGSLLSGVSISGQIASLLMLTERNDIRTITKAI